MDCFRLITEIERAGVSNIELARRLQVPRSTLLGWKAGSEPRWTDGQKLVMAHGEICGACPAGPSLSAMARA